MNRWLPGLVAWPLVVGILAEPVGAKQIVIGPPPDPSVVPGELVTVPIIVDMSAAAELNIANLQFEVSWDRGFLTYVGPPDQSGLPPSWSGSPNETEVASGVFGWRGSSATGTTETFEPVGLVFQAANVAELTNARIGIRVDAAADESAVDLLAFIEPRSVPLCIGITAILGDVNDDTVVDIIDAQQVARHSVGLETPNALKMAEAGDVTQEGTINITDAQQIARHSVGLDSPAAPRISDPLPGGCPEIDVEWTFASVSAGGSHTCGVTTDAAAYCWGSNDHGQLGDGTMSDRQATAVPVTGGFSFASVSAGGDHTCGVTANGAGYCWGTNGHGQLGDGTTTERHSPVPVSGGLSFLTTPAGSRLRGTSTAGDTTVPASSAMG
jgi:hypothetical protein